MPRKRQPLSEKYHIDVSGCWIWLGYTNKDGYLHTSIYKRYYERAKGKIPMGLELDHLCRNIKCVNPDHLEAVTHIENKLRAKRFKTHCINGHEYTIENTSFKMIGRWRVRRCKTCHRLAEAARRNQTCSIAQ